MRANLNFDFIVALALFVTAYATLTTSMPSFAIGYRALEDPLLVDSEYLLHTLIANAGEPGNWSSTTQVNRIGLAYFNRTSYPYVLSLEKIKAVNGKDCASFLDKTDTNINFKFRVDVKKGTKSSSYECNAELPLGARLIQRPVKVAYIEGVGKDAKVIYNVSRFYLWTWLAK
ncbi:hypothetical protein DRN74_00045 [Candidatus Micrarchaeota archaeon]|nr:MAG: hypothetical protein DRN74_00045 [Candidatus Micrarchaeota archaeon]